MANLAIRGHEIRGIEVIEILEMLGGKNITRRCGLLTSSIYFINENGYIDSCDSTYSPGFYLQFTLPEFFKKFPYKVGDFVNIPEYESEVRICKMRWEPLGNYVEYLVYRCDDEEWYTAEELNEYNEPHKEEIMKETEEGVYAYNEINCYHQDFGDKVRIRLGGDFEIKVEDKLTYIVRKKPQYPDTYKECCSVLGMTYDYPDIQMVSIEEENLYSSFIQLIRCRDAYWKIAGKEMGLGKPWKPDFEPNDEGEWQERYGIYIAENKIEKDCWGGGDINIILTFPTEEMRNAFYENFKDLIETCKELL